jgi:hypothetical protein
MENITNREMSKLDIFQSYQKSEYLSIKHSTYFMCYEKVFREYVGSPITFVEVGILNGGSLFMWRDYFGPNARIIGIDFNPAAKRWEDDGFEVYIGDQADPKFWDDFFSIVGKVDVVLDDGGHTNRQQIITSDRCIPNIKDGGVLMVEDVHTSYFKAFGNPSKYSFINFTHKVIDSVNSRFPKAGVSKNGYENFVYSLSFYESIVCFHIDSERCFKNSDTRNNGTSVAAEDFRHASSSLSIVGNVRIKLLNSLAFLRKYKLAKMIANGILNFIYMLVSKKESFIIKTIF